MSYHVIFTVGGLIIGTGASGLVALFSYADEPLLGMIPIAGSDENEVITARNKKRRTIRSCGFFGIAIGFALQLLGFLT
jgi:hypothetical protein